MKAIDRFRALSHESHIIGLDYSREIIIEANGFTYCLHNDSGAPWIAKMAGNELDACLTVTQALKQIKKGG